MGFFGSRSKQSAAREEHATLEALSRSQAIIEFKLDGTILRANQNFLAAMGYELAEVAGKHHSMFVEPDYAKSAEYQDFWARLRSGKFDAAEYRRLGKGGREVWIHASYNPVLDENGQPFKVLKIATDVTAEKVISADNTGKLNAISKSQAVIEFKLDGTILSANENFCDVLGYRQDEIVGRHHRMFVLPEEAARPEYQAFWDKLARGEYQAAEYRRIGKGGKDVWIQASYNPIFDINGKPYKVVKFATSLTGRKAVGLLGSALARLADGELSTRIDTVFEGEIDSVRKGFNEMAERLSQIMSKLCETSSVLKTATGEILSGANDLADRTTRHAAAIEETSATMEELSNTVRDNATRTQAASENSDALSAAASSTGAVMSEANLAMERISSSSSKISNIIGMIDDIAFQTNLLALNASVEAARAGDAGKGFAVVAVEVRRLAQSAAGASSEVKALVEQSATEVSTGSKLVSSAAAKLDAMVEGVRQSGNLIAEIASATQRQSASIGEVTSTIRDMDEMTQHNAALVEEMNAAIEQTENQARELDDIVEVFTLEDGVAPSRAPAPAVRPSGKLAGSIKAIQKRAGAAVHAYASQGNAALKQDWNEF